MEFRAHLVNQDNLNILSLTPFAKTFPPQKVTYGSRGQDLVAWGLFFSRPTCSGGFQKAGAGDAPCPAVPQAA